MRKCYKNMLTKYPEFLFEEKLVLCLNRDRIFVSNFSNLWYFRNFCSSIREKENICIILTNFPPFTICMFVTIQLQSGCVLPSMKLFVGKSSANELCLYHGCVQYAKNIFLCFFGGLQCVCHSFAYVAHFVFLRDVWIRAAVESRRAIPTHLPLMGSGNSEPSQLESNILLSFWSFYRDFLCFDFKDH